MIIQFKNIVRGRDEKLDVITFFKYLVKFIY